MASIYRRAESRTFTVEYFDHEGRRRRQSAHTSDRRAAERIAAGLEEQVALRRAGLIDVRAEAIADHAARPIEEHVQAWLADVLARGRTKLHVSELGVSLRRLVKLGGIRSLSNLAPSAIQQALAKVRESGLSLRSVNRGLRAAKSFTRWLVRDGRLRDDPIVFLSAFNAETDRRLVRRAMSDAEIGLLLASTETSGARWGLTGRDRTALYRLALATGFRCSEIESLTVENFRLDDSPPTVTVTAAYSKRRREDVQPIAQAIAEMLRPWVNGRSPGERVVSLAPPKPSRNSKAIRRLATPLREIAARMLRADAKAAGITEADALDFHCLRHTFVTRLVRGGVDVKTAQELSRHSDPRLTIGRYAHARLEDKSRALETTTAGMLAGAAPLARTGSDSLSGSGSSFGSSRGT